MMATRCPELCRTFCEELLEGSSRASSLREAAAARHREVELDTTSLAAPPPNSELPSAWTAMRSNHCWRFGHRSRVFRPNEEHATTGLDHGFRCPPCLARLAHSRAPRTAFRAAPPPRHRHRTSGKVRLETAHRAAPAPARARAPCAFSKLSKRPLGDPPSTLRARCRRPSATGAAAAAATAAPLPFRRIGPAPSAPGCELPPHGTLEVGCFSSSASVFRPPPAHGARPVGARGPVNFFRPHRARDAGGRVRARRRGRGAPPRKRCFGAYF